MSCKITFETSNAAFGDNGEHEAARLVREVASQIADGESSGTIRDYNGNKVGSWSLELETCDEDDREEEDSEEDEE